MSSGSPGSAAEDYVVALVKALPLWVRYPLTLLAFWPTVLKNRLHCALWPASRQLWNRVPGAPLVVGSAPLWESDVRALVAGERVRCVVNLCKEWRRHSALYEKLGVEEIYLPTVDFDTPGYVETQLAVARMRAVAARGDAVFVHCKAGKGRSVCVALAYLVTHHGLAPRAADALIRGARPIISKKWNTPLLDAVARAADDARAAGAGAGAGAAAAPAEAAAAGAAPPDAAPPPAAAEGETVPLTAGLATPGRATATLRINTPPPDKRAA